MNGPGDVTLAVPGVLLVLLVAGHLIGDFGLQTRRMAAGKADPTVLLVHSLLVALAHLLALIPYLGWPVFAAVVAIAAVHGLVDRLKVAAAGATATRLRPFLIDQAAHLAVLIVAWLLLLRFAAPQPRLPEAELAVFVIVAATLAALAFNATGGAALVSGVLAVHDPALEAEAERRAGEPRGPAGIEGSGRVIGMLERTLTLILILAGQWAAIMLLLTAKSIARFDDLKERRFAEYYLIGTLTSLLVAIVTGLTLGALLAGL